VVNLEASTFTSLRYIHPTWADLEVEYYSRDNIKAFVSSSNAVQLPSPSFILYIDDFGIHRNMYRALKGFYFPSACLDYQEQWKIFNEFTLTLGLHSAVY
jgi:hypothetical protein